METIQTEISPRSAKTIYEMLFADRPELFAATVTEKSLYPWNILLSEKAKPEELQQIMDDAETTCESRHKILAARRRQAMGLAPRERVLYGVIVEIGLEEGLDVLAAYENGFARYLNHSGKMIFWDTSEAESAAIIGNLFENSMQIIGKIGPWTGLRKAHPVTGMLRISFLVSDGLYFGEGAMETLFNDALAGPALRSATDLMIFLTSNVPLTNINQ